MSNEDIAKRLLHIDRVLFCVGVVGSVVPFSIALYFVWQKVGMFESDLIFVVYAAALMGIALLLQHVIFKACLKLRDRVHFKYIHEHFKH